MSHDWNAQTVVIVGAGRSGIAATRLLEHLGARVVLTDARGPQSIRGLEAVGERVRLVLGGHPDDLWASADAAVASPGIAPDAAPLVAARNAGVEIISEVELAYPFLEAPIVAITGSNGKSTVTSMVGAILERAGFATAVCGNIGLPLSTVVLETLRGGRRIDRCVIEISSFQTQAIDAFRAQWNAILNISPDHLDRHGDLASYAAAKLRLLRNCGEHDWVVFAMGDALLAESIEAYNLQKAPFGTDAATTTPAAWIEGERVVWRDETGNARCVVEAANLRVVGSHNLLNIAAAVALACLAGATPEQAAAVLERFDGLEHRMEPCGEIDGVVCINDSKATNVGATAAALEGLAGDLWLILGGRDKGSDFSRLRPLMGGHVRRVLLIGEASGRIAASLQGAIPMELCGDLATALDRCLEAAGPGDVVLLAPACTSFDQYEDFEARGRHFKALVGERMHQSAPAHRA